MIIIHDLTIHVKKNPNSHMMGRGCVVSVHVVGEEGVANLGPLQNDILVSIAIRSMTLRLRGSSSTHIFCSIDQ